MHNSVRAYSDKSLQKQNLIDVALIIILCLIAYTNSLSNQFTYDDNPVIVENYLLRNFDNVGRLFSLQYFNYSQELTYRPIVTISYLIDYILWGLKPLGYHLMNLIMHIMTVIISYFLIRILMRNRIVGLWGALLFAVHPINTEAVNSIAFREDLIATLFYFLSFLFYIKSNVRNAYMRSLLIASVFFYIIAMFAKESAVTLILVILLYDFLFNGLNIRKNISRWTLFGLALMFYLVIRFIVLKNPEEGSVRYIGENVFINFITMIKVIGSYLLQFIVPIGLSADYTIKPVVSILNLSFLISLIVVILLIVLAIIYSKKNPLLSFFIFFFFIGLLPVMNFIPISNPRADRYLYLICISYTSLLSYVALTLLSGIQILRQPLTVILSPEARGKDEEAYSLRILGSKKKLLTQALLVLILIFYTLLTIRRNAVWRDDIPLWQDALKKYPNSKRATANLGREYLLSKQSELALPILQKAVALEEKNYMAYVNLGIVYTQLAQYDNAIDSLKKAIALNPHFDMALNSLGNVYIKKGEFAKAIESYQEAMRINPEFAEGYCNMGIAYAESGLYKEAEASYKKAIELNRNFYEAYSNLGTLYIATNQNEKALVCFQKAISLRPNAYKPLFSIGMIKLKMGDNEEAIDIFKKAELLNPRDESLYYSLGAAYDKLKDTDNAIKFLKKATEINPDYLYAHFDLGVIYAQRKMYDEAAKEFEKSLQLKPDLEQAKIYLNEAKKLRDAVKKN